MNPIINRKQDILYKDLAVDLTAHRVSRAGHELLLTPREFALLAVLVTNCDTGLSRSQLLEAAWGYAFIGEPHRGRTYQPPAPQARPAKRHPDRLQGRLPPEQRQLKPQSALHFFTVQGAFLPFQKVPYSPPGV